MEKARHFFLKIFKILIKPEMRILPGQLAFFIVMTLIPLVALVATVAAALSISTDSIRLAISGAVPKEVANIINTIMTGNGINFNIMVFYISALILASNGPYSMINVSNEIYKVKPNTIIKRRIKALGMTFMMLILFLFLLLVPVFGKTVYTIIQESTNNENLLNAFHNVISILKYPIIILVLFISTRLMFVISPDQDIPKETTTKGALFTTIGWILSTEVFSFYIGHFARYDIFYGSISNILVLLLWVYLLSYIYVLGMVINASNYKNEEETTN